MSYSDREIVALRNEMARRELQNSEARKALLARLDIAMKDTSDRDLVVSNLQRENHLLREKAMDRVIHQHQRETLRAALARADTRSHDSELGMKEEADITEMHAELVRVREEKERLEQLLRTLLPGNSVSSTPCASPRVPYQAVIEPLQEEGDMPCVADTTGPKLCNDFDDCGGNAAQPFAPRLRMSYIEYQESGFDPAMRGSFSGGSFSGLPAWGGSLHDTEGRPDTNGAPNNQSPPDLKGLNGIHPNHGLVGTPAMGSDTPGPGITPRTFSARRSFTEEALAEWVHGNRTRGQQNVPNQQNREVLSSHTTHTAPMSLLGPPKQISSKSTTMSLGCQTEPDMWYVLDVPKEGGAPKASNRSKRPCFSCGLF